MKNFKKTISEVMMNLDISYVVLENLAVKWEKCFDAREVPYHVVV
jgi:hypothetical protein